jgi:hypothetical protein
LPQLEEDEEYKAEGRGAINEASTQPIPVPIVITVDDDGRQVSSFIRTLISG